jgi:hypothetical protein
MKSTFRRNPSGIINQCLQSRGNPV